MILPPPYIKSNCTSPRLTVTPSSPKTSPLMPSKAHRRPHLAVTCAPHIKPQPLTHCRLSTTYKIRVFSLRPPLSLRHHNAATTMTMTHREIIGGDGLIDLDAALVPAPLFSSPTSSASTPRAIPQPTRVTPAIPTFVPFTKEELKAKVTEDRIKARIAMLEKGESSGGAMASDRKLKGEYAATTRAVGGKKGKGKGVKAPRECRGVGECEDALCSKFIPLLSLLFFSIYFLFLSLDAPVLTCLDV
ncbi:hypothetical protein BJ875DRAFT_48506 [Amylocarpus encephaloides]|uniref:Uncharacterized protein n=1 Tax=Amylocarpus encephaloides TaxID=45428 RepID=A0A9P7YRK4_9HELO|nr:hypothetical protein BJ875DRAFT_48506 [Amylocarpus encephaloides]